MMEQVLTKYNFRIEMGISVREFLRNAENIKLKLIYDEATTNSMAVYAVLIHKKFGETMLYVSEEIANEILHYATKNELAVKHC